MQTEGKSVVLMSLYLDAVINYKKKQLLFPVMKSYFENMILRTDFLVTHSGV